MKRTKLRALLKILVFAASLLLLLVLSQSLFPPTSEINEEQRMELSTLNIKSMQIGDIRKIRFNGKEVGVLKRETILFKEKVIDNVKHQLPDQSLDKISRSRLPGYYVFYNVGDSGNCPLFYDRKGFKDICSQKRFDNTGREIGKEQQGFAIKIPPHFFNLEDGEAKELVLGSWSK